MEAIAEQVKIFFQTINPTDVLEVEKLPKSGGDRMYFRIHTADKNYIATYSDNLKENQAFLHFTRHLKKINAPLPEIFAVNNDQNIYIQEDFGTESLLDVLEREGYCGQVFQLFQKSLKSLAWLQIKGHKNFDYGKCLTSREFGKKAILTDLLYFKYYFLDPLKIAYEKEKLIDDFEALSTYLTHVQHKYFMFRDFQSRNIMVRNDEVHFIDYQGGMRGALQYDVASLLWQAKANLPDEWKQELLEYYIDAAGEILQNPIDRSRFTSQYHGYVLIRLLQVLGAYGFRGLFERKAHFLTSIPLALRNLKWFLENKNIGIALFEFERVLQLIVEDKVIEKFQPVQADASTPLIVQINSFSFLKSGYPTAADDHGGGFVFDCRGLLNPGRYTEYKTLTGRDKGVKDFLEQQTKMPEFLNNIYNLVDITVEDYIRRKFGSLTISFGCTGGQHRSVYAADALARHLRNKFRVPVKLNHLEQKISEYKTFEV